MLRSPHEERSTKRRGNIRLLGSIDLHGQKKERAISLMTIYFSQMLLKKKGVNAVWVEVITGCGKHSSQGPVLRSAVEATLKKRHMEYWCNEGKGSFTVRVDSGMDIVSRSKEPQRDTKIIVLPPDLPTLRPTKSSGRSNRRHGKGQQPQPPNGSATRNVVRHVSIESAGTSSSTNSTSEYLPLPSEVASDDSLVSQIIEKSRKEALDEKKLARKELMDEERARELSLQANEIDRKEEALINQVISLSSSEFKQLQQNDYEYEKALNDAIACSSTIHQQITLDDCEFDEALKEALQSSLKEEKIASDENDYAKQIENAIALSMEEEEQRIRSESMELRIALQGSLHASGEVDFDEGTYR